VQIVLQYIAISTKMICSARSKEKHKNKEIILDLTNYSSCRTRNTGEKDPHKLLPFDRWANGNQVRLNLSANVSLTITPQKLESITLKQDMS
jgi:hypothetical protein